MPQKYRELTRLSNRDYQAENDWFRHCTDRAIPYITIHVHGNLADVRWDYINFPTKIDTPLFVQAPKIQSKARAIYEPLATKTSWISLGPGVISFKNISISGAKDAAEQLFDVILDATASLIGDHTRDA